MNRRLVCLLMGVVVFGFFSQGQAAQLAHRWSFNGDLKDSVGDKNATIVDGGSNDAILSDTEVTLTGGTRSNSDYVDLPDHVLSSLGSTVTIEVWATQISVQNWSRVFAFGSGTAEHMCMSWCKGTDLNTDHVEYFTANDNSRLDNTNAPYTLGVQFHIVVVFEPGLMSWYTARADSARLGEAKGSFTISDVSQLNDINCWLGRSHYEDGTANASYDEFRLWIGALSETEREELHQAGPDAQPQTSVAYIISPGNNAGEVSVAQDLVWGAGAYAASHDVYFGTVRGDVENASRDNPLGVLISRGQVDTMHDLTGALDYGQIYYWRIDEVNPLPDETIFKGDVWTFTTELYAYPIEGVIATSNATSDANSDPEKTVDGSGLNDSDQHSTLDTDMWAGTTGGAEPVWIQYEFDRVHKLHELWVWNYNLALESMFGLGFKDVAVEYSTDRTEWTTLGDFPFVQATGKASYKANTVVDFNGAAARYVRLTAKSAYGTTGTCGLSEVRFYYVPVLARQPQPEADAVDVSVNTILDWRAGREAASHQVYLGTDADDLALAGTVTDSEYDPGTLDLGTPYYWKIVEVNDAETPSTWEGGVWSFTTEEYKSIDNFESYNNSDNLIYETWYDGFGGDTSLGGSMAGYIDTPFMETGIVRSDRQSMPFAYDNDGGFVNVNGVASSPTFSEVVCEFDSTQDWTAAGAETLVLYFCGCLDNDAAQLYLKVNSIPVDYDGGATQLQAPVWKQWSVDLASLGSAATKVRTLTIGVSGGGSGLLYIDDIRLYRTAPSTPEPAVDPGTGDLVARYTFENNLTDVTGNGHDGSSPWAMTYVEGPGDYGQAVSFNGQGDYVDLAIGSLVPTLADCTIATLVNFTNNGNAWQRIFDFGNGSSSSYMLLCPCSSTSGPIWFAITTSGGGGESVVTTDSTLPTGWHHVAVVIVSAGKTVQIYVDGQLAAEGPTATLPTDLGTTAQNWLGRSQYEVDEYFEGSLDDFRIYRRALSGPEIRYLVGDR